MGVDRTEYQAFAAHSKSQYLRIYDRSGLQHAPCSSSRAVLRGNGYGPPVPFLGKPTPLELSYHAAGGRITAAQKIRNFAMGNAQCSTPRVRRKLDIRETLLELAAILEENDKPADPKLLNDFMIFTNDLDADRGQDFASVNAELKDLIVQYGAPWNTQRSQPKVLL